MRPGQRRPEPLLSVVIPAYNEADNLRRGVLQQVTDFLAAKEYTSELLVVDDGSQDDSVGLIERQHPTLTLIRNRHQGKAASVRKGLLAAAGRYVIFMDMDLATPLVHIDDCLAKLEAGYDVVIGSRRVKGARRLGDPIGRKLATKAFSVVVRALLLPEIRDSQCGFKGFRREVAHDLFRRLEVFAQEAEVRGPRVTAFDVELLLLARKGGYRIVEIPVAWRHVGSRRVALFSESLRMFWEVLRVWWNDRQGKYNLRSGEQ